MRGVTYVDTTVVVGTTSRQELKVVTLITKVRRNLSKKDSRCRIRRDVLPISVPDTACTLRAICRERQSLEHLPAYAHTENGRASPNFQSTQIKALFSLKKFTKFFRFFIQSKL